ncbi:MAG: hypothetical protein ACI8P9_003361 [Parasphingorhabdus sp.]|jgi:hypothetical protein
MKLIVTKSDWGMESMGDLPARMQAIADAGFDGLECFFVDIPADRFTHLCAHHSLSFNAGMVAPTVEAFRAELARVLPYKPLLINCHAGRDYYDFPTGVKFFKECMQIASSETDIQVVFETHRRCTLYSPWGTRRYLEEIPDLRICSDFSHFTVVSEGNMQTSASAVPDENGMMSIVDDPEKHAMMDIAISRADHIHARVGDLHRPQVADARIGEGYKWTELFESWWDRIIELRLQEDREFITVCPEWGPPPYAPVDPATGLPHADPWDLSIWSMQRFRERWQDRLT